MCNSLVINCVETVLLSREVSFAFAYFYKVDDEFWTALRYVFAGVHTTLPSAQAATVAGQPGCHATSGSNSNGYRLRLAIG